jgi:hypothetical protein
VTQRPNGALSIRTILRIERLLLVAFIGAYFLFLNWDSLRVRFVEDDMMNMAGYWRAGPWHLLSSQFAIWRGVYRPMGGVFYVPLLRGFGLNPAPFHAVYLALLLANVYLVYRFARVLGCAQLASGLAALIPCYHVGMAILYYAMSNVYDVLCCLFYLWAFAFYAQIRQRDRLLRSWERALFLLLFLCALNSKEMAVTLPVILLAYEAIYHGLPGKRGFVTWLCGPASIAILAAILSAVYIYGRVLGPEGLATQAAYAPVFSMHRVWIFQMEALNTLMIFWKPFSRVQVVVFWVAILYAAFRRRRPALRFCCVFLFVTPLPVEFLAGRGEATLYLPMAAWAVIVAAVFVDVARAFSKFLGAEPMFRHAGRRACFAVIVVAGVAWWTYANHRIKKSEIDVQMAAAGKVTGAVIQQLRDLHPDVRPGSQIVFLDDPFQEYDMAFIAELYFRDPSISIRLGRKTPLSPQELARVDHVFTFAEGKLMQIR